MLMHLNMMSGTTHNHYNRHLNGVPQYTQFVTHNNFGGTKILIKPSKRHLVSLLGQISHSLALREFLGHKCRRCSTLVHDGCHGNYKTTNETEFCKLNHLWCL